jgi:hypothetical protein
MASGVRVKDIAVTDGWEMQIVRVEPGARLPAHTHEGPEFLFILEGESCGLDAVWAPDGRVSPVQGRSTRMCTQKLAVSLSSSTVRDMRQAVGM